MEGARQVAGGAMVRFMSADAGSFPPKPLSLSAGLDVRSGHSRVTPRALLGGPPRKRAHKCPRTVWACSSICSGIFGLSR